MLLGECTENLIAYMHFLQIPAGFDDGDDPVDPAVRRTNMAAVSSGNLCADVSFAIFSNPFVECLHMTENRRNTNDRTFCSGTIMSGFPKELRTLTDDSLFMSRHFEENT